MLSIQRRCNFRLIGIRIRCEINFTKANTIIIYIFPIENEDIFPARLNENYVKVSKLSIDLAMVIINNVFLN